MCFSYSSQGMVLAGSGCFGCGFGWCLAVLEMDLAELDMGLIVLDMDVIVLA